jgi:hypothetical protein
MRNNAYDILLPEPKKDVKLDNVPNFSIPDFDLSKDKEVKQYFFTIERICRNSYLYKRMISFLREYVDMNQCSFYKNVNNIDTTSIKIHIHHSPLTLFDIVTTVFQKRAQNNEPINVNMVAKEVLWLHYRMQVGLIPLSETVHELVHNGFLFVPTTAVYGYYDNFVQYYGDYMDNQTLQTLKSAEEYSKGYNFNESTKVLTMDMVYLDTSGCYSFPKLEDVVNALKEHIDNYDVKVNMVGE